MADPANPKFFQANVEMECNGARCEARGMISERGVTRIYLSNGPPKEFRFDMPINVKVDFLNCQGILMKQIVEHGIFYEVQFLNLKEAQLDYIRQRVESDGINPGWQRKFPRISVVGMNETDLPVPNLCMVRFVGQEVFVNVMNFTLGGLRIETMGDALGELRVGARIQFDLMTTMGDVLRNMPGEVRNISFNEQNTKEGKVITRSFGIKLLDVDPVNEKRYKGMIKDYCLALQKKLNEK
jgi:hypothetical protein